MKDYVIGIRHGIVTLDEVTMRAVAHYYNVQMTKEYLEEIHPELGDAAEEYAERVRGYMDKYNVSEEEAVKHFLGE